MTEETAERLKEFFAGFTQTATPLLLLDYDGTLAPFHIDRFQARPWPEAQELLRQIQNEGKTRIVVVSGRPASEIVPLLGLEPAPEVWGLHGVERRYPGGRRELEAIAPQVQSRLDALKALLRHDSFGGLLEEKPNAAVVHWRGVAPERALEIEQRTRAVFEPAAKMKGLTLLQFEAGLELRAGRDKGGAVKALLQEANHSKAPRPPAAYLGDDITDEAAFAALKGQGLSVLVREEWRETLADVWLRPPEELHGFLAAWLEACRFIL